jgi:hypothetical protein
LNEASSIMIALSAPMARQRLRTSSLSAEPIVATVTVPPCVSLILIASSTA